MLYELIGPMLSRAAEILGSEVRTELEKDEFLVAQVDAICAFVGEVGAMWPNLFTTLQKEHDIYWAAIRAISPETTQFNTPTDLVRSMTEAQRLLAELVEKLHRDNATEELAVLRNAMRSAAILQEDMIIAARNTLGLHGLRRT